MVDIVLDRIEKNLFTRDSQRKIELFSFLFLYDDIESSLRVATVRGRGVGRPIYSFYPQKKKLEILHVSCLIYIHSFTLIFIQKQSINKRDPYTRVLVPTREVRERDKVRYFDVLDIFIN